MKAMKEYGLPVIVLTVICLIISSALVFTYQFTKPRIDAATLERANAARMELLPEAKGFDQVEAQVEGVTEIYKSSNDVGYVISAATKGFKGTMNVMVGIDKDGKISGVKLMENSETAGLGSNVGEPPFTGQFVGKDSKLEGIETISGATISSNAFLTAVGNAYQGYNAVKE